MIEIDERLIARTLDVVCRVENLKKKNEIESNNSTVATLSHFLFTFENNSRFR